MDFWHYLAQVFGIVVTILCVINPFFKKKWQMLVNVAAMNTFMALNFLMLNDFKIGSAIILNVVAVLQAVVNYIHTRRGATAPRWEQIVFTVLYIGGGVLGLLNATGFKPFDNIWLTLLELLPVMGALCLMLSVFAPTEQGMRKFTLVNALIWSVYTAILLSTNFFAEILALISTSIALYKYRQKPDAAAKEEENQQSQDKNAVTSNISE